MNDPVDRRFPVYLPPDYDPKKTYPVAYLLAGFSGRASLYVNDHIVFEKPIPARWDKAIAEKKVVPFIGVFPDGSSRMGCSQYVNSPAFGNYMDYLCDEIVPFIESKFSVTRDPHQRILAGHSSGGFGALVTGMIRPDVFKIICSSAGDGFYEVSLLRNIAIAVTEIEKAGGVTEFLEKFLAEETTQGFSPARFDTMLTLAMAPCYAPNVKNAPLFGDPFFDLKTGEVIPEIWEKYLAWDPVRMADVYLQNLKQLDYVLLEAGLEDEHGLQLAHRQLAKKFQKSGIPYDLVEYPGKHGGHHWRYGDRLVRLIQKLKQ